MKYSKKVSRKNSKVVRKNPLIAIIPAIPAIAEIAAGIWTATVSAAPYIAAALTAGAGVGLIEKQLNDRKTNLDKISRTIPPILTLPEPLEWLEIARSRAKPKKAKPKIPLSNKPIQPIPQPPPTPNGEWFKKLIEWFKKSADINPKETMLTFFRFLKQAPRNIYEFLKRASARLDAWEKENVWKFRLFLFVWIVVVSPQIGKLVDYLDGSTAPFYADNNLSLLKKTLDKNIDAYPLLKNLNILDTFYAPDVLVQTYPDILQRSIYRYELKTPAEIQANKVQIKTNIEKFQKDAIGFHNQIYVPSALQDTYLERLQVQAPNFLTFEHLQGFKSSCDIDSVPPRFNIRYSDIYSQISFALTRTTSIAAYDIQTQVFSQNARRKLAIAISVVLANARKYWQERYDLACNDPTILGLVQAKSTFNNLPAIFDTADRNVPYVEEGWTWAAYSFSENLVPTSQTTYLPTALKPAYYYDVLQYIQDQKVSTTIKNLLSTNEGKNKLRNVEMIYANVIRPIKKSLSPIEEQRIAITSIWTLLNDAYQLRYTPISEDYYVDLYIKSRKGKTFAEYYTNKPFALFEVAIENFLYNALGFKENETNFPSATISYAYFQFALELIELADAFETGVPQGVFLDGLKSILSKLADVSQGAITTILIDYVLVVVSMLLEKNVALLKSQTMVIVTLTVVDLILPDFIQDYFKSLLFFAKDQNTVVDPIADAYIQYFVDTPLFTYGEVCDGKTFSFDRIFIPSVNKCEQTDYLDFCLNLSQLPSSKIIGGVIFYNNLDNFGQV